MIRALSWTAVAGCCALLLAHVVARLSVISVVDDAYMFIRYADNLLHHGALVWNVGGEPTYGTTSLLHLLVVVPVRAVVSGNATMAAILSSLLPGLAMLVTLGVVISRFAGGAREHRALALAAVALPIALAGVHLADHFTSGMDTSLAMLYLASFIGLARWYEESSSLPRAIALGVLGGCAFWVRPDLALYPFLVGASLLAIGSGGSGSGTSGTSGTSGASGASGASGSSGSSGSSGERRPGLVVLVTTALSTALLLAAARAYFGTALPLPYYAKRAGFYGEHIQQLYAGVPAEELVTFLMSYWWLVLLIAVPAVVERRRWWNETTAVERGLLVATALFLGYYLVFVTQIMHYHQRFYYPTLPALAFLAAMSGTRVLRWLTELGLPLDRPWPRLPATLALWLVVAGFAPGVLLKAREAAKGFQAGTLGRFGLEDAYAPLQDYWVALDEVSRMPNDVILATTEVGLPGVMNQEKAIVDLAGLNDRAIALQGFSADAFFDRHTPDLVYTPHPNYREMLAALESHPRFRESYHYFTGDELGATMGVALLLRSPHYPAMLRLLDERVKSVEHRETP